MRKALKDDNTLNNLENSRAVELEKVKKNYPWELITNPTLSDKPVEPKKKQIVTLGGIFGFLISLLVIFYKEMKRIYIFFKRNRKNLKTIRLFDINQRPNRNRRNFRNDI